ncbi:RluA family pseudouridine synthase [Rhodoligotrophos defluvii]|uniref:RluA family pseudouridine synthase n=1 Tax=Rhodoligotrophos defluvii TaxID=2561934 RepID=UPI0010C9945E|nr:RluA family pseudouridine synthase [Rhodoligotrophos defluvii]
MTDEFQDIREITVADAEQGERLDRLLARHFGDISRSRMKALIEDGRVTADGCKIGEARYRVKPGERISLAVPPPVPAEPEPEPIPLNIVYEDDQLIVIDKPAGLVVHPAAGNWTGTLVNALIARCGDSLSGVGGVRRPGIVHRLDKDTTGLLVVAKTDLAHASLSEQFQAHGRDGRLERVYTALVWGKPARLRGTVSTQLGRMDSNRQKIAVLRQGGRSAITHYETAGSTEDGLVSCLRCRLETGRTHQIRVHMAHIGHPLLGDVVYGRGFATRANKLPDPAKSALVGLKRQALHAQRLGFDHPVTGQHLVFESPLPADMANLAHSLKFHSRN